MSSPTYQNPIVEHPFYTETILSHAEKKWPKDFRAVALEYLESRDWVCQPLRLNDQLKAKIPITPSWPQIAAAEVSGLAWEGARGIGLLTGPTSGSVGAIDVDDEELALAVLDWTARQATPPLSQHTVSGRCHVFAVEPEPTRHQSFKVWWHDAWRNVQFIGISEDGAAGNIAVAPTPGYAWVHPDAEPAYSGLADLWQRIMTELGASWDGPLRADNYRPAIVRTDRSSQCDRAAYDLSKYAADPEEFNRHHSPVMSGPPTAYGPAGYPRPFLEHVAHGDRNNAQFVEAASLFKRGASFDAVVVTLDRRFQENYETHPSDNGRGRRAMLSTVRSAERRLERERKRKASLEERRLQERDAVRAQLAELHEQQAAGLDQHSQFRRVDQAVLQRKRDAVVAFLRSSDDPAARSLAEEIAGCRSRFKGYRFVDCGTGDHGTQYLTWCCGHPGCPSCSIARLHRAWQQNLTAKLDGHYLLARLYPLDSVAGPKTRKLVDSRASKWRASRSSAKDSIITTVLGHGLKPYVLIAVPQPHDNKALGQLQQDWERDWHVEIACSHATPQQMFDFWLAEHERELLACEVADFEAFMSEVKGRKRFRGAGHFRRHATLQERLDELESEGAQPIDHDFVANSPEDIGNETRLHPMRMFSGSNPRRESPPCAVCGLKHGIRLSGTVSVDDVEWRDGYWHRRLKAKPVGWAEPLKRRPQQGQL